MDRVHKVHPLDGADRFWTLSRLRHSMHILAVFQLPHRLLLELVRSSTFHSSWCSRADWSLLSAASVFAANTILRSAVGAAFPLFARQMFDDLGVQWAGTLLGCLALVMVPIPAIFMIYGSRLRAKSKFAPAAPHQEDNAKEKNELV